MTEIKIKIIKGKKANALKALFASISSISKGQSTEIDGMEFTRLR